MTDVFVVRNRRDQGIGVCTVMEYVDGPSLADHLDDTPKLSDHKLRDLATLFRMLWSHRLSHGDAVAGNILFSSLKKRYMFIDVDNIKQHDSFEAAKRADMPMLRSGMPTVARYVFQNVTRP